MPTTVIVVDDFLENAMELREAALRLTYPEQEGAFPGRNSVERIEIEGLEQQVSRLTGERLAPISPNFKPVAAPCVNPALDYITGRARHRREPGGIGLGSRARPAVEHDRAIAGIEPVDFRHRYIGRTGDMLAGIFIPVANIDELRVSTPG